MKKQKVEPGNKDIDFLDANDAIQSDSEDSEDSEESPIEGIESPAPSAPPKEENHSRQPKFYHCRQCSHGFTSEESRMGRYSRKRRLCARCFIIDKKEEGLLDLPHCWGGYEAKNQLCYEVCKLAQGCMVEYIDRIAAPWKLATSKARRPSFTSIITRALRVAGRPLSVEELAVALEKESHGRWRRDKNQRAFYDWKQRVLFRARAAKDVISLNNGFFVWSIFWADRAKENIDLVPSYDKEKAKQENRDELLSPEQILEKHSLNIPEPVPPEHGAVENEESK